jgi:hypothetical protein
MILLFSLCNCFLLYSLVYSFYLFAVPFLELSPPLQSLTCAWSQVVNSWYVTLTPIALHSCNVPIVGSHSANTAVLPWRFVTSAIEARTSSPRCGYHSACCLLYDKHSQR